MLTGLKDLKILYPNPGIMFAAPSAFAGLHLTLSEPDRRRPDAGTSPRSDVTTPRTWSGSSRSPSVELALPEPTLHAELRDVADARCAARGGARSPPAAAPPCAKPAPCGTHCWRAPAVPLLAGTRTALACPALPPCPDAPLAPPRPTPDPPARSHRDQTRRKPRFSAQQIPDVMPAAHWD